MDCSIKEYEVIFVFSVWLGLKSILVDIRIAKPAYLLVAFAWSTIV